MINTDGKKPPQDKTIKTNLNKKLKLKLNKKSHKN